MKPLFTVSLLLSAAGALRAQPAAVQQFQNFQLSQPSLLNNLMAGTNAPDLYRGENEDVGPQRILRLNPRPKRFDVTLDSQVFYTDNANFALSPDNIGSFVFVNTFQAAFTPPPVTWGPGNFAPAIGLASQWYNYGKPSMQAFDFEAQTLFVNGKYSLGLWQIGLGASYNRLVDQSSYDETYREFLPNLGVQRIVPLCQKLFLVLGDQVAYHFSQEPLLPGSRADINNRFDNTVNVSLNWQVAGRVIVQPFYRFQYSFYPYNTAQTGGRNDFFHGAGLTVAWYATSQVTCRAFFNYNLKRTDDAYIPAFEELNGGAGLSFDWKF